METSPAPYEAYSENVKNGGSAAYCAQRTAALGSWGSRVWGSRVWGSRGSRATDFGSGVVDSGNLESGGLESGV